MQHGGFVVPLGIFNTRLLLCLVKFLPLQLLCSKGTFSQPKAHHYKNTTVPIALMVFLYDGSCSFLLVILFTPI